jgi:hypothetical protein
MLKNPVKPGLKNPGFCLFQLRIDADNFPAHNRRMAKNQKLNGDLLTDEEKNSPMGLGYVSAAERLNLIYSEDKQEPDDDDSE